jgi:hypothetical protein
MFVVIRRQDRVPADARVRRLDIEYIMDEAKSLERFGLKPDPSDLPVIRELLVSETQAESQQQGAGDTELMKLCCVQLFGQGDLQDALLIWRAKNASMDAACAVDIQLLCGAGLSATKEYLARSTDQNAAAALQYLRECEAAGAFDDFSPGDWMKSYQDYYYLGDE